MIKNVIKNLLLSSALLCGSSCSKEKPADDYTVSIAVDGLKMDTVTMFSLESDYNHLRVIDAGHLKNGRISFKGQLERPCIAMLKFGEKDAPFYFILENCLTEISINKKNIVIQGGLQNHEYFALLNHLKKLQTEKAAQWSAYSKHLKDSTLTEKLELKYYTADSVLRDSIQLFCVNSISRNDMIGRLLKEKCFHLLDSAHVESLHTPNPANSK